MAIHLQAVINKNSPRFNRHICKTEKKRASYHCFEKDEKGCDNAASAQTAQKGCDVLCIQEDSGTDDSKEEKPGRIISLKEAVDHISKNRLRNFKRGINLYLLYKQKLVN